jgi:hypothetical protein
MAAKGESPRLAKGALAGLIATVPMTLFMLACHRNLPPAQRYPLPPSLIAKRSFGGIALPGKPAPMPNLAATLASHFGFGAATGALFAAAPASLQREYPVGTGIAYGLCVWAASYLGWVPVLGLMPPATRQPTARNAMMIAAHVVWGATLGVALNAFSSCNQAQERSDESPGQTFASHARAQRS